MVLHKWAREKRAVRLSPQQEEIRSIRQQGLKAVKKNIKKDHTNGVPKGLMEKQIIRHVIEKSRRECTQSKDIKPIYSGESIAVQWPTMKTKAPCITCLMDRSCADRTDQDWLKLPERLSTKAFHASSFAEVETIIAFLRMSSQTKATAPPTAADKSTAPNLFPQEAILLLRKPSKLTGFVSRQLNQLGVKGVRL